MMKNSITMEIGNTSHSKERREANEESSRILCADMLGNLPENVILHILSFLPTESTIRTGSLARRWKSLWKEVRHLNFDSKRHKNRFSDHVISALISYQNRVFESLTISVATNCDSTELSIWLGIALLKNVSKLVLRLNEYDLPVTFPERSLGRTNTLKILEVSGNIHFDLPIDCVYLNCLKEMHLCHVTFENEVSFTRLLGGCPTLECLVVDLFLRSGTDNLIINVPSLQRLTLASGYCIEEKIILQTPCLKYLNTMRLDGVVSFKIENVSKIVEATITHHEQRMDENILFKLGSAQSLSLAAPLKLSMGVIFEYLTSLEIDTKPAAWTILLAHMLTYSPKLQVLKLAGGQYCRVVTTWVEPEITATCLRSHLHTVVWEKYNWDGIDEIDVATYILKNAAKLKDASFTTPEPTEDTDLVYRQAMLAQLANVERASTACNIVFKDIFVTKSIPSDPDEYLQEYYMEDSE